MKIVAILILAVLIIGCGFPQNPALPSGVPPKVIDLEFDGEFNGISTEWHLLNEVASSQRNFNINFYPNVDSVIFKASLRSERSDFRCAVELFDITDELPIESSRLYSIVRYQQHSVRSSNLKYNFRAKEILLGVRIRSESNLNYVEARHFSLLVYYH